MPDSVPPGASALLRLCSYLRHGRDIDVSVSGIRTSARAAILARRMVDALRPFAATYLPAVDRDGARTLAALEAAYALQADFDALRATLLGRVASPPPRVALLAIFAHRRFTPFFQTLAKAADFLDEATGTPVPPPFSDF